MATNHALLHLFLSLFFISQLASSQSDNYIIHMDLSAMPKAFADHHSWYSSTLSSLLKTSKLTKTTTNTTTTSLSLSSKLIYSYTHVVNGFSANLSPSELEALKASPGYISSFRDLPVKVDTTHSSKFLGLNSNSGTWPASHYGKDVIVGLVDSGVWPESESFNDAGMSEIPAKWKGECEAGDKFPSSLCNKKLIGARFFNKGLLAKFPNITIAVNSTRDTDGHGTHTSTTAAGSFVDGASFFGYASGKASGMAPQARVAMYKALWDEGVYSSDIIAAIDKAIDDGVDVLSLSFGLDGVALYEDPVAIATFSALEKGVFVSTSAGNEGPFPASLHNGIPWVLTVAAGTLDRDFAGTVNLGNEAKVTGLSLYPGSNSKQLSLVFMGSCDSIKDLIAVGHKFVVCEDINNTLADQFENVDTTAGARDLAGAVFITNNTDLELLIQSNFPAIFVKPKDGEAIKDYIKSEKQPKASMTFHKTLLGTKPAPSATSYTSRGPSPSSPTILKPDIMAPGSLVLAAWPPNISVSSIYNNNNNQTSLFSKFALLSGTSMSCPHAAGVAALLKQVYPKWSPAAIRSALMTTSDTVDNTDTPIKDIGLNNEVATPLAIGAGHINPNKALNPGLVYDVNAGDYVNFLCALNFTERQIKVITKSASFNCSKASLDLNYPSFIAFFNGNFSNVQEFQRTVTNVGEGQASYAASVTPMKEFKVKLVPDNLVFKEKNEKLSFKLIIEGPKKMQESVVFGYLSWVDSGSKHVVRSPIVATSLNSTALS